MKVGIKGRKEILVNEDNTALNLGSGSLKVFATPAMVSLIEKTCWESIDEYLEDDKTSVGTNLKITHESASPIGMRVWCESELIDIDRKKLTFKTEVFDEKGLIGRGIHERFIVSSEKFIERTNKKLDK